MVFDIEYIVDIHTYPGECFCPVCRTFVLPNGAFQSQCTHLYRKPCLAYVANGSRVCPYDGYLVTEADSKPLIESDKTLAECIGKIKVRRLNHRVRSGCTWEGPLSECTSHCSGCSFGNSPVICNRCGVWIVRQQVHEHAVRDSSFVSAKDNAPKESDIEMGSRFTRSQSNSGVDTFNKQIQEIEKLVDKPSGLLKSLKDANAESTSVTKASAMKGTYLEPVVV